MNVSNKYKQQTSNVITTRIFVTVEQFIVTFPIRRGKACNCDTKLWHRPVVGYWQANFFTDNMLNDILPIST